MDHRRVLTMECARYLNHSCRPNAKPVLRKGRIVFVALRRIAPGEEITYDYGRDYFDAIIKPSGCRCAACRAKTAARRSRRKRRVGKAKRAHGRMRVRTT